MYRKILVAVDNTKADDSLLPHITRLAKMLDSKILLVHVANGWAARNFEQLQLTESEEMKADKAYLEKVAARLREQGVQVTCLLAMGNPPDQILKAAGLEGCDLIALTTHGHRFRRGFDLRQHHRKGAPLFASPVAYSPSDRFRGESFVTRSTGIESPSAAPPAR